MTRIKKHKMPYLLIARKIGGKNNLASFFGGFQSFPQTFSSNLRQINLQNPSPQFVDKFVEISPPFPLLCRITLWLRHTTPQQRRLVSEDMLPQGTESPGKGTVVSEDFIADAIDTSRNKGSVASDALSIAESVDILALGCAVLGRGAEPPQFWVLLIWLEPGISHVTWVHYDATMCLACLVCSVLPVLHFLRFGLFVL